MQRAFAIYALATLIPNIGLCDQFRCGSWLVSTPLPLSELIAKCGQPSSRKASTQDVRTKVGAGGTMKIGTTTTEIWRYDRGSGAPPMVVTVVDGVIQSIEQGE
jgi:Protein of unknown function (DUF2845)